MRKSVWDGVYAHWDDAPKDDGVFNDLIWLDRITESARKLRSGFESKASLSPVRVSLDYALPLVAGMTKPRGRPLVVLDFGGGLAASYFPLVAAISGDVDFHIVETDAVCERGCELFSDIAGLHFHSNFPEMNKPLDIVHAGSSIQYVEDIPNLLQKFSSYRPRYLLLADVLAGDIESFVTVQAYYGRSIRTRFLNFDELIQMALRAGFNLIYKSRFSAPILGKLGPLPMDNFDEKHKLDCPCQLLFKFEL